jgi:hypothetical protein
LNFRDDTIQPIRNQAKFGFVYNFFLSSDFSLPSSVVKDWLCFFAGKKPTFSHIILLSKSLRHITQFEIGFVLHFFIPLQGSNFLPDGFGVIYTGHLRIIWNLKFEISD